jgi:DNA-directed RNA polymerase specialized sigma subunit
MPAEERPSDIEHYRRRRRRRARDRRMLNNLPLAHRLAATQAEDPQEEQLLLGQAMVGLVRAADAFEQSEPDCRFGAYAEPHIASALERDPGAGEVQVAQAEIAEAISSQERVQELAAFLDVPVDALVGGLMDVTARERVFARYRPLRDVA